LNYSLGHLSLSCDIKLARSTSQVIQRRGDFGNSKETFNRDWADYKNGFGDPTKEFWIGNENIYTLTSSSDYVLRIELEDFEGNKRSISACSSTFRRPRVM
jgi:Fibrinogen beta and gamma chains, C-terminal globular domain